MYKFLLQASDTGKPFLVENIKIKIKIKNRNAGVGYFFQFYALWKCDASKYAMKDVFIQSCTHTKI